MVRLLPFVVLILLCNNAGALAVGHERAMTRSVRGPVEADLVRVIDGDTLLVDARPWPQQTVRVYIRLRGINAPELHAHCAATRARAQRAMRKLIGLVAHSGPLVLRRIAGGKYFGRVLATVETANGTDLSDTMLASRLVVAYGGGKRHAPSCDALAAADF